MSADPRHSAAFFGDDRDHWWSADFAELMARRWGLGRVHSLLDVGCGVGHLSRLLFPFLAPGAELTGIDREPGWVEEAGRRMRERFPEARATFSVGEAQKLPFPDGSFDAAACQTVLMHLPDPEKALAEMVRVVRPGGLVIACEPDNLWGSLDISEATASRPPAELADVFLLWLTYQRGKRALGQGDHAIGERLPGLFRRAGLRDIAVHLNDRAAPMQPPYETPAERAQLATLQSWWETKTGGFDRAELERGFRAGGGDPALLARAVAHLDRWFEEARRAIEAGTYAAAGGAVVFLVSGRKS